MNYSSDINKIRSMIRSPAAYVEKMPFSVNSYNEVVNLWKTYKKTGKIDMDDVKIRNVFDFHKSDLSKLNVNLHSLCTWKDIIKVIEEKNMYKNSEIEIRHLLFSQELLIIKYKNKMEYLIVKSSFFC